jgi:hypothetical protein
MSATFTRHLNGAVRDYGRPLGRATFVIALVAVVVAAVRFLAAIGRGVPAIADTGAAALTAAVLVYTLSHGLRMVRLAVLVSDPEVKFARLSQVHMFTAAVSFVTPFKLGEIYRVVALGHVLGSTGRSLVIVWVERAFDSAAIMLLILGAWSIDRSIIEQILPLILMSLGFVAATVALFTIVPERLGALSLFILSRYDGERPVRMLRRIQWIRHRIALAGKLLDGKVATLAALTLAIWSLELITLGVVMPRAARHARDIATGLPLFLSGQTSGGVSTPHDFHSLVIAGTLLILGALAGLLYAPVRLARPRARRTGRTPQSLNQAMTASTAAS